MLLLDSCRSPTDSEPAGTFEREGFGRQSISEKRKGHLDPRISEFYQQIKLNKDKGFDDRYYGRFIIGGTSGRYCSTAGLKLYVPIQNRSYRS